MAENEGLLRQPDTNSLSYNTLSNTPYDGLRKKSSEYGQHGDPVKSLTSRDKTLFLVIFFISRFCLGAFVALMAPFYPTLAAGRGVNKPTIGVIFSCYQLGSIISSTCVGWMMTVIGHKFIFVTGLLTTGVCSFLFGFLEICPPGAPFIGLSIAIRSIEGVGSTAVNVVGFAVLTAAFPERMAFLSGSAATVMAMGLTAGPAIGGALYQAGGFGLPFWSFGILLLVVGCITFFLPFSVNINESTETNINKQPVSYWTLLREPMVVILLSFLFTFFLYASFLNSTLSLYLTEQFQLGQGSVTITFLLLTLCYATLGLIFGRLGDSKIPLSSFLVCGYFVVGVALFFFGPAPFLPLTKNVWLTIGSMLCGHSAIAVMVLAFPAIVEFLERQGYSTSGVALGLISGLRFTSDTAGGLIGPVLGGVLTERLGFPSAAAVISIFIFLPPLSMCFYLMLMAWNRKKKQPPGYQVEEDPPPSR